MDVLRLALTKLIFGAAGFAIDPSNRVTALNSTSYIGDVKTLRNVQKKKNIPVLKEDKNA